MLKIVALANLGGGTYKRCTFQRKRVEHIDTDDLERLVHFIEKWAVENSYKVNVTWTVDEMSDKVAFIYGSLDFDKLNDMVCAINKALEYYYY